MFYVYEGNKIMTDLELLHKIDDLVSSDTAFDADCLSLEESSEKERMFAELIVEIYKLVHPYVHKCCKRI